METIIGTSRDFLFSEILPKNCICAEIGVRDGFNAQRILNISNPKKLYLIDSWDYTNIRGILEEDRNRLMGAAKNQYEGVIEKFKNNNNIEIIRKLSVEASKQFEDNYFDWVYIDAFHDYLSVKEDCESWCPKIGGGGYLCGHDYVDPTKPDVLKAVNEFCKENKLEIIYKGCGRNEASEWCIKK